MPAISFICVCHQCVFRSGKNWGSFDVGELGSADNGDADMRIMTHDRSHM